MAHIKKNGRYVVKVIMGNETGIPDLLACIGGKFVAIEVKAVNTLMTRLNKPARGKNVIINSFVNRAVYRW